MNVELERFLDGIEFDGRLALDGSVQRYGRKRNKWVWSIEREGHVFITAGDWSTGEKVHFGRMTHVIQRAIKQQRKDDTEKHAAAAERALTQWSALESKPTGRTYLERKGVAGFGVKYAGRAVFVPMRRHGLIVGLQMIDPLGNKRFTPGCSKRGAAHVIGEVSKDGGAVLCEGYATGASIHMATGRPVIVAFDCGNLMPVAEWYRGRIAIVAADNDLTEGNPGVAKGNDAALAVGASIAIPPAGMDWNDVHQRDGLDTVRRALTW